MKKGFTLIEMLSVIVILTVVSLIIFPEVNKVIKTSKQKSYETQINNLITATKKLVVKNTDLMPEKVNNQKTCITLTQLMQAGEIETDVITDPRNSNNRIEGVIVITYNSEYDSYIYSYSDTCPNNQSQQEPDENDLDEDNPDENENPDNPDENQD